MMRSKKTFSRKEGYSQIEKATTLLLDSHRKMSHMRRARVRSLINQPYQNLCSETNLENDNNEFLFGNNLSRSAQDVSAANKVTSQIVYTPQSKNFKPRGRGGQNFRGMSRAYRGFHNQGQKRQGHYHSNTEKHKYPKKD